jgi:hypothetical protein
MTSEDFGIPAPPGRKSVWRKMMGKNPLDDIVDELAVFKHEDPNHPDGHYFSNNPLWRDSRIREHWMARHSDEAKASQDEPAEVEEEEEEEAVEDYTTWTNDRLREELVTRGLSVEGKKADLISRLQEDDETEDEETD